MLTEETKENLRQAYHWVTSLSEDSLLWLARLRSEVKSQSGDAVLANAIWVQLEAYEYLYDADPGVDEAQFLIDYRKELREI